MKKSLMWMLTVVMAITFAALLYFQIMYLENMVKMRDEQFTEGVMRALNTTSEFLERQETLHYLEQDVNIIGSSLYDDLGHRYGMMQEVIRSQYLYQKGLLDEVILSILRDSSTRPIMERADSTVIRNCLTTELANNGVRVPFVFAVLDSRNDMVYQTEGYQNGSKDIYSIPLFNNTDRSYTLNVEFPTKSSYIFKSVRFIIPTLAFTVFVLVLTLRSRNVCASRWRRCCSCRCSTARGAR